MQASVWQRVHERLDPLLLRPKLRPDVVVRQLESRPHRPYFMAKSLQAGTYVRLAERERQLLDLMDGSRTIKQIVLEDFIVHKNLAFNRVNQLVELLEARLFLTERRVPTYALLAQRLHPPSWAQATLARWAGLLTNGDISLRGLDPFVTALHRSIGWLLFSTPLLLLLAIAAIAGLLVYELAGAHATPIAHSIQGEHGLVIGAAFGLFIALSIFLHELAHALTCKAFGREVRRGGFHLFFGFPAFYVDTSDIWLESRRRRIAVSAAGALCDLVVAGGCTLLALVLPSDLAGISLAFAAATYTVVLLNLFPLVELDGYYILLDLLDMPNLRPRSFAFLRESLFRKLWRRERFTRDELTLSLYGALSLSFTVLLVVKVVSFWNGVLIGFLTDAIRDGNWLLIAAAALLLLILLAVVSLKLARLAHLTAGLAGQGARYLARVAEQVQRRPRARLLVGIPLLAAVPPAQLDAIASVMRPRHFRLGSTIIRQGERGDRFFLIVNGGAEVLRAPPGPDRASPALPPRRVALLGPGDYFGELALLNQARRAATVQALTPVDVLELRADDFERLVSPTWQLRQRMERAVQLRETVISLPLFRDLRPAERDLLLSRVREESFQEGDTIIRQGEQGDRFYVILDGEVQVLQEEPGEQPVILTQLAAGDFFGEIALLFSAPRNATVVAMTQVRVWSLGRREFDDLLRHYLGMDNLLLTAATRRLNTSTSGAQATLSAPAPSA